MLGKRVKEEKREHCCTQQALVIHDCGFVSSWNKIDKIISLCKERIQFEVYGLKFEVGRTSFQTTLLKATVFESQGIHKEKAQGAQRFFLLALPSYRLFSLRLCSFATLREMFLPQKVFIRTSVAKSNQLILPTNNNFNG